MSIRINLDDPDIMDTKEACKRWGILSTSALRKRIDLFPPGTLRKFGKQWVVTAEGMKAVFGPEPGR